MRRQIIAGNWKMNKTGAEAIELVKALKVKLINIERADMVVCPPFTALYQTAEILKNSKIKLGAQDMHWEESGAYTGEISASMLKALNCDYVIIGHSERRQYFGETNQIVNNKVKSAIESGLIAILCVGESLEQRKAGATEQVVEAQLTEGLDAVSNVQIPEEVHQFIRDLMGKLYDSTVADEIRIQYGGSVKPENAAELLSQPDIDGALVGGASLKADSFVEIVKATQALI